MLHYYAFTDGENIVSLGKFENYTEAGMVEPKQTVWLFTEIDLLKFVAKAMDALINDTENSHARENQTPTRN